MAYSKHTWSNGEVITADKMNNIEQGFTDIFTGVATIRNIHYSELVEGTTDTQEYFKAWIKNIYDNYKNMIGKAIIAPVNPNSQGICIGHIYITGTASARYANFTYLTDSKDGKIIRFGYEDYEWYWVVK